LLAYGMFLYIFNKMQPLFDVIDQIKNYSTDIPSTLQSQFLANKSLFMQFLISVILLAALAIIIYIIIIALSDSIIVSTIKNQKYTAKKFFLFIKTYSAITAVFLLLAIMFFTIITDPIEFYLIYIILFILYIYILLIFQIVIDDKKRFLENIIHGFKALARIRYTIIPVIATIIAIIIILLLNILLSLLLKQYIIIFAFLIFVLLSLWVRNYFYKLFIVSRFV